MSDGSRGNKSHIFEKLIIRPITGCFRLSDTVAIFLDREVKKKFFGKNRQTDLGGACFQRPIYICLTGLGVS